MQKTSNRESREERNVTFMKGGKQELFKTLRNKGSTGTQEYRTIRQNCITGPLPPFRERGHKA